MGWPVGRCRGNGEKKRKLLQKDTHTHFVSKFGEKILEKGHFSTNHWIPVICPWGTVKAKK